MRECGTCTLCCRLPKLAELDKPFDVLCRFNTGTRCTIYETRPAACRAFNCMWLQDRLPEPCKPSQIGAVFGDNGEVVTVWVEPGREWQDGLIWDLIGQCLRMVHVCVVQSGKRYFITGNDKPVPPEIERDWKPLPARPESHNSKPH